MMSNRVQQCVTWRAHDILGQHGFTLDDFTSELGVISPKNFSERVFVAAQEFCSSLSDEELAILIDDPFVVGVEIDTVPDINPFFRNYESRLRRQLTRSELRHGYAAAVLILGVFLVLDERDNEDRDYAGD